MQHIRSIPFHQTKAFSTIFLDYIGKSASLEKFYKDYPSEENFLKAIQNKTFPTKKREILVKSLYAQYEGLAISEVLRKNIEDLRLPNTFTVTTAHQPNIFFGQLYFVYKILTTIKLAARLKEKFPAYNFVPVYWMGSEDHDFEEISHFRLFGKTYRWETSQKGAVGRMCPHEIKEIFQSLPEKVPSFEEAYLQQPTLAKATAYAVNQFFGEKGLVVINGDDATLKKNLIRVFQNELLYQKSGEIVREDSQKLEQLGYKAQVNPRNINLFYLDENLRERIELVDGKYRVVNTDLYFSEKDILQMAEERPEVFSPNAVLRPVYQEACLPNLAYVGGPGELAYWLQLKNTFEYHQKHSVDDLQYPILFPRMFALMLQKNQHQKIEKLHLGIEDLFLDEISLKKYFVEKNTSHDFRLHSELEAIRSTFRAIQQKAQTIDKSLEGSVAAEEQKVLKSIESLEKRLQKAEERNQETQITQVLGLKEKLFPNGNLQERTDNFLNFQLNYPNWFEELASFIEPFDFQFQVFELS
jgi:bacillithiol biosynthesis cysteine-adding enzyme BshC